jgi:glycosyltransferase involved in cell wall biosynthesis
LSDTLTVRIAPPNHSEPQPADESGPEAAAKFKPKASTSLHDLWKVLWRWRQLIAVIEGALLFACILYFVGRLTRDKGLPELIQAFDTIQRAEPAARLLLVGWFDAAEDAVSDDLRAHICNHPGVICTGFVDDTAPYYRGMDVLVLPTWREGFPNVVLEAAATGIPVVTTECTGARDSVVPEVTGLLIPPGYPDAIAEAVLKIIRDPERQGRMGKAARAWVLEHFLEERVLGLAADYYRSLLESAPIPDLQRA